MNGSLLATDLTSLACLPTREKYYSEDGNAPLERIGEWYLYTTDNGIPYYFNARTKKVVWDRPYRDIIPSPQSSDHEDDDDIDLTTNTQPNRLESIPFGNTPFPNSQLHSHHTHHSSSDDDASDTEHTKTKKRVRIDIDDFFKTDRDKVDEQLQHDPDYNSNIPPARLTYPANELELLLQSTIHEFAPKLGSKNVGCCSFHISPTLPEGVDFDPDSGAITGYPMQCTHKSQLYTITASNSHGSTSCNIEITVKASHAFTEEPGTTEPEQKTVAFGFSGSKVSLVKETKELRYDSAEEALAAFYELLANKGIGSASTWNAMQHKLRRDPRYTALATEQQRKCAFAKYKSDLIFASGNAALITAEKHRVKQLRAAFKRFLREVLSLERLEYVLKTYALQRDGDDDEEVLVAVDIDELCTELQGDERYHGLEDVPEERRAMIVDHIQVLEYQRDLEVEAKRKRKELERKEDFIMLLHELSFGRIAPVFHAKSEFKRLCADNIFVSDARFAVFVSADKLDVAKVYFEEFCIAMEHTLEADKQILKSFLRNGRMCVNHNDTVQGLVKYFASSSRLSMIDRVNLRLLFKEMIGKQRHLVKAGVIAGSGNKRRISHHNVSRHDDYDRNSRYSRDRYDKYERDRDRERDWNVNRKRKSRWDMQREPDRNTERDRDRGRRYDKKVAKYDGSSKKRARRSDKELTPDILVKPKAKSKAKKENRRRRSVSSNKSLTPNVITKPKPKERAKVKIKIKAKKSKSKCKVKEDGEIEDNEAKKPKKAKKSSKKDSKKRDRKDRDKKDEKEKSKNKSRKEKKEKTKKRERGSSKTKRKEKEVSNDKESKHRKHRLSEKNSLNKYSFSKSSNDNNNRRKYKEKEKDNDMDIDNDRWQPQQRSKKRKRENVMNETVLKRQRIRDREIDRDKSNRMDDDGNDRWKPSVYSESSKPDYYHSHHSHSTRSDYKKYRNVSGKIQFEQETQKDKHRKSTRNEYFDINY